MQEPSEKVNARKRNYTWFRMYSEFSTDPKVQMLSEADQRRFVMLLCMRCNGPETLHDADICFVLRITEEQWCETKRVLQDKNLIDSLNNPVSWDKRQYASDFSSDRVAKYRQRRIDAGLPQQHFLSKKAKADVLNKNDGKCVYCGTVDEITVVHITPVDRGGDDDIDNLQPACRSCNADKRNMTHEEYLTWNGRVTLQKRPQNTETETEKDKITPLPPKRGAGPSPNEALEAFHAYNDVALRCGLQQAAKLTPDRQRKIVARLKDYGLDGWHKAMTNLAASGFLKGKNERGWRATLDFVLQPASFSKLHDGAYNADEPKPAPVGKRSAVPVTYDTDSKAHKAAVDKLLEGFLGGSVVQ